MRKRFLVLSCVAAMSLASLATSASASTTVTTTTTCSGVYSYVSSSTITVNGLSPLLSSGSSYTYTFYIAGGAETCIVKVS
jgi:hypothetical protein